MEELNFKERELVALGAALGANCAPCAEHHVGEARKAGLSDSQISAAIELADRIRKVPAAKALDAALQTLNGAAAAPATGGGCEQMMAGAGQMMAAAKASGCCS